MWFSCFYFARFMSLVLSLLLWSSPSEGARTWMLGIRGFVLKEMVMLDSLGDEQTETEGCCEEIDSSCDME